MSPRQLEKQPRALPPPFARSADQDSAEKHNGILAVFDWQRQSLNYHSRLCGWPVAMGMSALGSVRSGVTGAWKRLYCQSGRNSLCFPEGILCAGRIASLACGPPPQGVSCRFRAESVGLTSQGLTSQGLCGCATDGAPAGKNATLQMVGVW